MRLVTDDGDGLAASRAQPLGECLELAVRLERRRRDHPKVPILLGYDPRRLLRTGVRARGEHVDRRHESVQPGRRPLHLRAPLVGERTQRVVAPGRRELLAGLCDGVTDDDELHRSRLRKRSPGS